jgi:hypothetical protein
MHKNGAADIQQPRNMTQGIWEKRNLRRLTLASMMVRSDHHDVSTVTDSSHRA